MLIDQASTSHGCCPTAIGASVVCQLKVAEHSLVVEILDAEYQA